MSLLSAKELVSDMLAAYEAASIEDTQLEASLAVFSRKKQADFIKETENQQKNVSRSLNRGTR